MGKETPFQIGIRVPAAAPLRDVIATIRQAEAAGIDMAWLPDSPLNYREIWSVLGAAALATDRIGIGPAVTNFSSRHLTVTAAAARTVAEAAPGRFSLGIGSGDSAVGFDTLRLATLAQMERGIGDLRALMAGDDVDYEGYRATLREAASSPPILLAASGPRTLALAGQIADGAIVTMGHPEAKIAAIRAAAAAAGRPAPPVYIMAHCGVVDTTPELLRAMKHYCALVAGREGTEAFEKAGFHLGDRFRPQPRGAKTDMGHVASVAGSAIDLDREIGDEVALWFMRDRMVMGSLGDVESGLHRLAAKGFAGVYLTQLEASQLPDTLIEAIAPVCRSFAPAPV